MLLVRDPYWLQACWDVSRQNVARAKAALAEHWHTAKPTLRLLEVNGCLGGVWTAGLLSWILDAGNKPGIMQEMIARLNERRR